MGSIAFLVQRIGPYHHARLAAWAEGSRHQIAVIEFRVQDRVYAWAPVSAASSYARSQAGSRAQLLAELERLAPKAVVCVGYSDPEIHAAVAWALRRKIPLVVCSDSTYEDEPRSWIRESCKRLVVGAFATALVAGSRAEDYLRFLGLDPRRCFRPWDVVDNGYFAAEAEQCRQVPSGTRARLGLPERYFLCVSRFVPKKNLPLLITAFGKYVAWAGRAAWPLVLVGSGPLEAALRAQAAAAGLSGQVTFAGFLQYPDLPACYGLAGALVLPSTSEQWGLVVNEAMAAALPVIVSTRCGCVPELVREGENGYAFAPEDANELASCLQRMARLEPDERRAMGRRSQEIVAEFAPSAFARGVEAAIAAATAPDRRAISWPTRVSIRLLGRRPAPDSP